LRAVSAERREHFYDAAEIATSYPKFQKMKLITTLSRPTIKASKQLLRTRCNPQALMAELQFPEPEHRG
jgi:hypothetical protein